MFKVNIDEENFLVCAAREYTIIGNTKSHCLVCPNHYSLEIIASEIPFIKYTNLTPIIIKENDLAVEIPLGIKISDDDYNILYDLYLSQMEENPTEEYLKTLEIKKALQKAKTLTKKPKKPSI